MSLEAVVEDIRDAARERAREIREDAEAEAEAIVSEAEADAESVRSRAEREATQEIEREREQRLSSATLEAKQERLAAKRDVLESVREAAEERVAGLSGDRREELTRELLDAAAAEFADVDAASVYGAPDDAELLETLVADHDGFSYAGEYDCIGGVVVESEGSRLRVNNTFDSILEAVWEDHLRDVSSRLFDERDQ